jgi:hypothetical protein
MTDVISRRFRYLRLSIGLHFVHDGSAVIGWNSPSAGSYSFLRLPGGGAVAGSYSLNGTTTTWVPLLDTSGSTIALVNAAATNSPPSTTYTYSPSGTPTASGTANDWPFQYHGMEKEFNDPTPYYYSGSGQFYSPQMVRSLSEAGQTSSSGSGSGPSGNSIAGPSGSGPDVGRNAAIASGPGVATAAALAALSYMWGVDIGSGGILTPAAIIGSIIDGLVQLFLDIFGGSDTPPIPRQLLHARHPLYPDILGVSDDLIPDEVSLGKPQFCGDAHVCPYCPVAKDESTPEYRKAPASAQPSFASSFSNCMETSIAKGALPCYTAICGAGIGLFARGLRVQGGIAAGIGCGAAALTIGCCVAQGLGSDVECPQECPRNEPENGENGEVY